jgi:hypothetical protein
MNQSQVCNPAAGVVLPPMNLDAHIDLTNRPSSGQAQSGALPDRDEASTVTGVPGATEETVPSQAADPRAVSDEVSDSAGADQAEQADSAHCDNSGHAAPKGESLAVAVVATSSEPDLPQEGGGEETAPTQEPGEPLNAADPSSAATVEQAVLPKSIPESEIQYGRPVHPVCDLFPLMGDADLDKLAEDIKANGLAHAVVIHEDQIVDGRNRILACRKAKVEPAYVEWCEVYTGTMTLSRWIWSVNGERRHLTPLQLAAAHLAVNGWEDSENARQRQAEGRQHGGEIGGRGRLKTDSLPTNPSATYPPDATSYETGVSVDLADSKDQKSRSGDRRTNLVADFGISHNKAQTLLRIEKEAPELLTEVVQGKVPFLETAKLAQVKRDSKTVRSPKKGQQKKTQKRNSAPKPGSAMELGPELEELIRKAVLAVEKVLRSVPEDQQETFKAEVADNVRRLL